MLPRCRDIAGSSLKTATPPLGCSTAVFGCFPWTRSSMLGEWSENVEILFSFDVCLSVCLCVRLCAAERSSQTSLKRLKLRTSNLTSMFPGTAGHDPLKLLFCKNSHGGDMHSHERLLSVFTANEYTTLFIVQSSAGCWDVVSSFVLLTYWLTFLCW